AFAAAPTVVWSGYSMSICRRNAPRLVPCWGVFQVSKTKQKGAGLNRRKEVIISLSDSPMQRSPSPDLVKSCENPEAMLISWAPGRRLHDVCAGRFSRCAAEREPI